MIELELHGLEVTGFHGVTAGGARARAALPLRRVARGRRARRSPIASRTRSTTATSRAPCARSPTAHAYHLLEALAAGVADELLARFAVERVRVRVRKPDVELDPPVERTAVDGRAVEIVSVYARVEPTVAAAG